MELFLNRISDGLSNGATYALIAMALVMIFKATTLINFAQGEFAMFGGFIALVLASEQGLPMWIAVFGSMVITAVCAAGIERTLIRPFDPADHLPLVIITLGLFLAINALAGIIRKGCQQLSEFRRHADLCLLWLECSSGDPHLVAGQAEATLLGITQVIAIYRCEHEVLQPHELHRFCGLLRLFGI